MRLKRIKANINEYFKEGKNCNIQISTDSNKNSIAIYYVDFFTSARVINGIIQNSNTNTQVASLIISIKKNEENKKIVSLSSIKIIDEFIATNAIDLMVLKVCENIKVKLKNSEDWFVGNWTFNLTSEIEKYEVSNFIFDLDYQSNLMEENDHLSADELSQLMNNEMNKKREESKSFNNIVPPYTLDEVQARIVQLLCEYLSLPVIEGEGKTVGNMLGEKLDLNDLVFDNGIKVERTKIEEMIDNAARKNTIKPDEIDFLKNVGNFVSLDSYVYAIRNGISKEKIIKIDELCTENNFSPSMVDIAVDFLIRSSNQLSEEQVVELAKPFEKIKSQSTRAVINMILMGSYNIKSSFNNILNSLNSGESDEEIDKMLRKIKDSQVESLKSKVSLEDAVRDILLEKFELMKKIKAENIELGVEEKDLTKNIDSLLIKSDYDEIPSLYKKLEQVRLKIKKNNEEIKELSETIDYMNKESKLRINRLKRKGIVSRLKKNN